jgi:hypothetical protein
MASGNRGSIDGGGRSRAADARAHRHATGAEPERRAEVRFNAQGYAVGPTEAEEGPMIEREASKHAVGRLVIQFRIERAAKRVAWFAAIIFVVALILSVPGVSRLIAKLMQI